MSLWAVFVVLFRWPNSGSGNRNRERPWRLGGPLLSFPHLPFSGASHIYFAGLAAHLPVVARSGCFVSLIIPPSGFA